MYKNVIFQLLDMLGPKTEADKNPPKKVMFSTFLGVV